MKFVSSFACFLLLTAAALPAQEKGQWRAVSSTARGITGDVGFSDTKISLSFSAFTLAEIRSLEPTEITALFHTDPAAGGSGHLFRTEIPGDKRFLHKNTLCGSEDTQWVVSFVQGHTLQLALFSGSKMPELTPEAVANTPSLCGTFSYTR